MTTRRQIVFVEYYVQCWNGALAARKAGYAPRSARVTASKLLTKDNIQALIQKKIDELVMSSDECLIGISKLAREAEKNQDKLRALKMIAQIRGMLVDRIKVDQRVQVVFEYEDSNDQETEAVSSPDKDNAVEGEASSSEVGSKVRKDNPSF